MRSSGILMHITSLPSPYGVGTMGKDARNFVDFLESAGQTYWQVLPLCPTAFGDSPYQTVSSYAGNPYLIDLDELSKDGFLKQEEYADIVWGESPYRVDYARLYKNRHMILRIACSRLLVDPPSLFYAFCVQNRFWLDDYALFMAIKERDGGKAWLEWTDSLRDYASEPVKQAQTELKSEIDFWKAVQYLFFKQWSALKEYANRKGIRIIGDIPIYVSMDSVDVWAHREQFELLENGKPIEVAGCPPDNFCATGQLWGNPLFNWEAMESDGFTWWTQRVKHQSNIYDVLRIDHFRGFDSYYAIPYGAPDAQNGRWRNGPGEKLFRTIESNIGKKAIIAEDLGFLTPSVHALRDNLGFPGMRILQFAFDSKNESNSIYLPHNYIKNCIAYIGTHDNTTAIGWLKSAPRSSVDFAEKYLRLNNEEAKNWGMMRALWASVSDTVIIQMQDVLGLDYTERMNTPSTQGGNWQWRIEKSVVNKELANKLRNEMYIYDRLPLKKSN